MLSKQRFNVLADMVSARIPNKEIEFANFEFRTVQDVVTWLDQNLPKPNGWTRDDVSWGVNTQEEKLPPSPSPELPAGKTYDAEAGLIALAAAFANSDPLWPGFTAQKWANRWVAGEFVKDIKQ